MKRFTLLELLLVVAIIAILLTILLPSLGKARETARRALCLSNQAQMSRVNFHFAKNYDGRIPLGYTGPKQSSYFTSKGGSIHNLGHLWMEFGDNIRSSFWCPSSTNEMFQYNTASNTWPPKVNGGSGNTRTAFNSNPITAMQNKILKFETNANGAKKAVLNGTRYKSMAILALLDNKEAMLCDWITKSFSISDRHLEGVNTTYLDGSGRFFRQMEPYIKNFAEIHRKSDDTAFQRIWDHFKESN